MWVVQWELGDESGLREVVSESAAQDTVRALRERGCWRAVYYQMGEA